MDGIPWFEKMKTGVYERADELGVEADVLAPQSTDPELQIKALEELIARQVDVIGIVPNDASAVDPVLKKARDAGIIVIGHEGPDLENVDWDFEMVSEKEFGEAHARMLCDGVDEPGSYVVMVGSLTAPTHKAWADVADAWISQNCSAKLTPVGDREAFGETLQGSRAVAEDAIGSYADLRGFLAFGEEGPIGAGEVIQEKGLDGKIHVVGTFSPSQGSDLVKAGIIVGGYIWDPEVAGRVFVTLGKMLADGQALTGSVEIEGLGIVTPDAASRELNSDKLIEVNAETVDALAARGL
jgi:simple sugar transport system substrate-binding protein